MATADVFVNGFRSGVAERMGLDYATLSKLNPRLVYVHAAGYGIDGPLAAPADLRAGRAGGRRQHRALRRALARPRVHEDA